MSRPTLVSAVVLVAIGALAGSFVTSGKLPVTGTTHERADQPAKADGEPTQRPAAESKKPNVVFILVDNVGWGDFSCYGGTVPTPRINSLATDGLRLNNYTADARLRAR